MDGRRHCNECKHYKKNDFTEGCEKWNCEYEPKEGAWIPYAKQKPKASNSYLVTLQLKWGKEIEIFNWIDGEWFEKELAHAVVAWRYLPEPWEGEEK